MFNNVDDLDHWLKLARETRALAKRVGFDTAKKRLLELAKDYDRIAVRKHERKEKNAGMKPKHPPGPPMSLGNMRALGVARLGGIALNDACRHTALIEVWSYPAETEIPYFKSPWSSNPFCQGSVTV
jgi:hypothetical protein